MCTYVGCFFFIHFVDLIFFGKKEKRGKKMREQKEKKDTFSIFLIFVVFNTSYTYLHVQKKYEWEKMTFAKYEYLHTIRSFFSLHGRCRAIGGMAAVVAMVESRRRVKV